MGEKKEVGLASAMKSSRAQRQSAMNIGPPPSHDGLGKTLASLPSEVDESADPDSHLAKGRCHKPFAFLKGLLEGRQVAIASCHSQAGDKTRHGTNAASRKGCDAESPCGDEESVYFTSSETSFRLRTAIKKKNRKKKDSQLRRRRHRDMGGEPFSGNESDFGRPEPLTSFSTFMRQTFARLDNGRDHQPRVCNRKGGRIVARKKQLGSRSQSPVKPAAGSDGGSFNFGWISTLVDDGSPPAQLLEPIDSDSTLTGASQSKISLPGYNYTKTHLSELPGFFSVNEPIRSADEKRMAVRRNYEVAKYDDKKRSARRSPTEIGVDQVNMRAVHLSLSDCSGHLRSVELLSQELTA